VAEQFVLFPPQTNLPPAHLANLGANADTKEMDSEGQFRRAFLLLDNPVGGNTVQELFNMTKLSIDPEIKLAAFRRRISRAANILNRINPGAEPARFTIV